MIADDEIWIQWGMNKGVLTGKKPGGIGPPGGIPSAGGICPKGLCAAGFWNINIQDWIKKFNK